MIPPAPEGSFLPTTRIRHGLELVGILCLTGSVPAAQLQFESRPVRRHLPPSALVTGVSTAAADLDADGDVDLVAGSLVLLNGGEATFTAGASLLPAGSANATSISIGDVDGNGTPDIVVGSSTLLATGASWSARSWNSASSASRRRGDGRVARRFPPDS